MDLLEYTLFSVSVAATLISVTLVAGLVVGVWFVRRLSKALQVLDAASQAGLEASTSLKEFVDKTTTQFSRFIETFVTIRGAKEVAGVIGEAIAKARTPQASEKKNKKDEED